MGNDNYGNSGCLFPFGSDFLKLFGLLILDDEEHRRREDYDEDEDDWDDDED